MSVLNNKNCMQKKVWKQIASNMNKTGGYNISDEQCYVKWKNLKRKYKSVRDFNNQTGRAKASWEYFEAIDEFINTKPEIIPLSTASSTHGFRVKQQNLCTTELESSDENDSPIPDICHDIRHNIRKRRRTDKNTYLQDLYEQREVHHQENIKMQKKFLVLFDKYNTYRKIMQFKNA